MKQFSRVSFRDFAEIVKFWYKDTEAIGGLIKQEGPKSLSFAMLPNFLMRPGFAIAATGFLTTGCGALLGRIQPSETQNPPQAEQPQTAQPPVSPSAAVSSSTEAAANRTPYPAEVAQNFINSCIQNGGNQEACTCLFNKVQERYSLQEFVQVEQASMASGKLPQEVSEFAAACVSQ